MEIGNGHAVREDVGDNEQPVPEHIPTNSMLNIYSGGKDLAMKLMSELDYVSIQRLKEQFEFTWKDVYQIIFGKNDEITEEEAKDKCFILNLRVKTCPACKFTVKHDQLGVYWNQQKLCFLCERISSKASDDVIKKIPICEEKHKFDSDGISIKDQNGKKIERDVERCLRCGIYRYLGNDTVENKYEKEGLASDSDDLDSSGSFEPVESESESDAYEDQEICSRCKRERESCQCKKLCKKCKSKFCSCQFCEVDGTRMKADEGGEYYCPLCAIDEVDDDDSSAVSDSLSEVEILPTRFRDFNPKKREKKEKRDKKHKSKKHKSSKHKSKKHKSKE